MATRREVARLEVEVGELLDHQEGGLSLDELPRKYAASDGGPSITGFVSFCSELFGIELTPQQREGAAALVHHAQVMIRGGNGVGKDTLTALWALYEVYVLRALVLLSGPTDRQVREVLMRREIGRLWRLSDGKLPGQRFEMAIRIPGLEEGGLLAFTASDPERFVGHHSSLGRVFVGLTEAQAIPEEIFDAAQRCQPTTLLAVLNPVTPACAAHALSGSKTWESLRWSCLDHPNVVTGEIQVPGAVDREWVERMRHERNKGPGTRFWSHAVLAEWPQTAEDSLVEEEWLEAATVAHESGTFADDDYRHTLGIDVARFGRDASVACIRRGPHVLRFKEWNGLDTQELARAILKLVQELHDDGASPVKRIVVDAVGIGSGVYDKLKEMASEDDWPSWWESNKRGRRRTSMRERRTALVEFMGGRNAADSETHRNARTESYWHVRDLLEAGELALPDDEGLLNELRATRVEFLADGRTALLSKDEVKKALGGASPDRADALAMSFAKEAQKAARDRNQREIRFSPPKGRQMLRKVG